MAAWLFASVNRGKIHSPLETDLICLVTVQHHMPFESISTFLK